MEGWITVQLTERGEEVLNEDPKIIESALKKITKSDYFIPVHYSTSKAYDNKIFLFTGYLFIRFKKEDMKNYAKLINTQYFLSPLLVSKKLHLTPSLEIERLKKELEKLTQPKIRSGDKVQVIDGKYKNLTAEVTQFYSDSKEADLKVTLKCMSIIVPRIPSICLAKIESEDKLESNDNLDKRNLSKDILNILTSNVKGLSRKEIVDILELDQKELKRISTILSRLLKKGLINSFTNKKGKSVFVCKK